MKKATPWLLAIAHILAITAFWAWDHTRGPAGNLLTMSADTRLQALGRLSGLFAASGILAQLMLIGRVRWIEGSFGLDRLSRVHHYNGIFIAVFLLLHPALLVLAFDAYGQESAMKQLWTFLKDYEDVALAAAGWALLFGAVLFFSFFLRRSMRYARWYGVHLAAYLALALAVGHQFQYGDAGMNRAFLGYWYCVYAFVLGNIAYYRVVRPLWLHRRHRFLVERVEAETSDVTSVWIGGRAMDSFRVRAGQFFFVRFWAKELRAEEHPFSMSIFPDGARVRLSIKASGDFTRRVPELKPGTPVLLDGPFGVFTSARARHPKILMIAGGIGITPIRALAEEFAREGRDVLVLYGNRTLESIALRSEMDGLAARHGNLRLVYVLSHEQVPAPGETGYVDREKIMRLAPDFQERDIFICGPPPMMLPLVAMLKSMGAPSTQIHFERFAL